MFELQCEHLLIFSFMKNTCLPGCRLVNSSIMSSIQTCHIVPCSLSDHSAVTLVVRLPSQNRRGSAYWHFNNSLLDYKYYRNIITQFWTDWRTKRCDFPSLASWWDFGKSHIKSLSQMYGSKTAKEKRKALIEINQKIDELQSAPDLTPETRDALAEQRNNLNYLLKTEAQGAFVRSRFKHTNETDSCSTYFFNLEKSNSLSKNISRVRLTSGLISEDPVDIKAHIRNFYKTLYSRATTDESALDYLLTDVTKHSDDAEDLDSPLLLEELDLAVKQLGKDKTPGLTDSLPNFSHPSGLY